jgi:hypothetical protein
MGTPPAITPIKAPSPPGKPVPGATPRIAPLPSDASTAPKDSEMITDLHALKLPEAAAILAAYRAFGDTYLFEARLIEALAAVTHPIDSRLQIHIARLSAEAYVLDIHLDDNVNPPLLGFIDRLDLVEELIKQVPFLHFVARRLLELSSARMTADMQRMQMNKTIEFFNFVQDELDRDSRWYIDSDAVLVDYRTFLFEVMQKHYQLLLDGLFASARGTAYKRAITKLSDHFKATTATDRTYKTPPIAPMFHIERNAYRDYFNPDNATEFAFAFYSTHAPMIAGTGPEIVFHEVIKKRYEQLIRLMDVQPGPHSPGGAAFPDSPKLHDNLSWQTWARKMWDSGALAKPTGDALEAICGHVSRYFHAFTVHVPYDLEEGSKTANYLTRTIPRAINGGLVHDCLVYASRWLFILSRLFKPVTMPRDLRDPRTTLIEMPAHAGLAMRVRLPLGEDALIAINNADFTLSRIVHDDDDKTADVTAAQNVVAGMYAGLKTPIVIHVLGSDITDANDLGREIAKISDRKLKLPYDDPSEPHLMYLAFLTENAKIQKKLNDQLNEKYRPIRDADRQQDAGKRRTALRRALEDYRKAVGPVFEEAADAFEKNVTPIVTMINTDIDEKTARIPKEATKVAIPLDKTWKEQGDDYDKALAQAIASLDPTQVDPDAVYRGDGFPTEVQ